MRSPGAVAPADAPVARPFYVYIACPAQRWQPSKTGPAARFRMKRKKRPQKVKGSSEYENLHMKSYGTMWRWGTPLSDSNRRSITTSVSLARSATSVASSWVWSSATTDSSWRGSGWRHSSARSRSASNFTQDGRAAGSCCAIRRASRACIGWWVLVVVRLFYGCFLVIEAHGGTWFWRRSSGGGR